VAFKLLSKENRLKIFKFFKFFVADLDPRSGAFLTLGLGSGMLFVWDKHPGSATQPSRENF
jgi:hypothetical protein